MKILLFVFIVVVELSCNNKQVKRDVPSSFSIQTLLKSSQRTENLFVLAKVWGFIKYYHPIGGRGTVDWDDQLFKILPRIANCTSGKQRDRILIEWVSTLGQVDGKGQVKIDSNGVRMFPDLDWLSDTLELSNDLSKTLIDIKNSKRDDSNHYVSLTPKIGNPIFDTEKSYNNIKNPDTNYRLLSLFRYWNIVNYFYPYKYLTGTNWDSVLAVFIPKFEKETNDINYRLTTLELISCIHDSHANIYGDSILNAYWGKYQVPANVKFVEDRLVVTGLINAVKGEAGLLDTGDIILSINDTSVENIIKKRLPITPASNYPTQLRNICDKILRTNDTSMKLTYKRNNRLNTINVKCYPFDPAWHLQLIQRKDTCFKFITPDIVYLYPGSYRNSYLPKILMNCLRSKGMIIDLRCYPYEPMAYSLGAFLIPSAPFAKFTNGNITTPGLFHFIRSVTVGGSNYYKGKIIILVNELTQSQAEFTAMAFRSAPCTTIIGSTTAGADGDISFFYLPGGLKTAISGIGVYYPDGKETQRVGIIPDIFIVPTLKSIEERRDTLIETAVEKINQKTW